MDRQLENGNLDSMVNDKRKTDFCTSERLIDISSANAKSQRKEKATEVDIRQRQG